MSVDYSIRDHKAWLGYIQPDGLVVSPAALVDAQVLLDRNTLPLQERFLPFVSEIELDGKDPVMAIADFPKFVREFLEWPDDCIYGLDSSRPLPESLFVSLSNFGETLAPSFAFKDPRPKDAAKPWLLLVQTLPLGDDLDARQSHNNSDWNVSPSQRFERLLRQTNVPIGLLCNGECVRLIYAPHGENSGNATFAVKDMTEVAGRPILAAFHMLLDRYRLLAAPSEARLPALLARSRDYQSRVSTTLAQQVLDALYEMLRGFQGANERVKGELLHSVIEGRPDDIYGGLLTVLMRLVFLLFAEDRGLMPTSELYVRHYSIHGLFERLRTDNEQYPDTMDHRYGAWAQLLTLFSVVYQGCKHPQMQMPARHGHLFDPARFPFLEGQTLTEARLPLVSDGTVFRVLEKLFILAGERLSYRTLDVEEIGSVYQTVMGFRLEVVTAPSIAIAGKRKNKGEVAAPTVINLNKLLATNGNKRKEWLKEHSDQELSGDAERSLKSAATLDDLMAALDRKIARNATPQVVPTGAAVLQPTDERRRSGSHYTPRSFTEPIVRTTLRPILEHLGEHPTPEQILDLKVCDLAVGSAAFLVETCRQLGDALVNAWQQHGDRPPLPPDETEELLARRLVAQRCLYGVDHNPMAVDLAKLSLWLATLAKDHPFTFLDHSIRCGDSLVGLTRQQIADFHWLPVRERVLGQNVLEQRIRSASKYRKQILDAGDMISPLLKHEKLGLADEALNLVREAGNLVIAAFFSADKDRVRRQKRDELVVRFTESLRDPTVSLEDDVKSLRWSRFPVMPFHWKIEFPEVFDRENPGFDAIVGNPPFMGGTRISEISGTSYFQWLVSCYPPAEHHCDLVAYFFRRAFSLLKVGGTFGLIATNTIAQGDTREGGLKTIVKSGGHIYVAIRRYRWPGQAAVIVSIVHIAKTMNIKPCNLDGQVVERISAYLFPGTIDDSPIRLAASPYFSLGCKIYGQGFLFDDNDPDCTPLSLIQEIITRQSDCRERILPYIGGEEFNAHPEQRPNRHVIYLSDLQTEDELSQWSELKSIVEAKVKPEREELGPNPNNVPLKRRWWAYQAHRPELYSNIFQLRRVLVNSQVSGNLTFAFLPTGWIYAHTTNVFCIETFAGFCGMQSRVHEVWARLLGSSMKDDLRYTASDCFETFPFPHEFESNATLEEIGREYYEFRASLMVRNNQGLTKTYNRFHDPDERHPDILRLRELHAAMDRAVLEAYGWDDIAAQVRCEFLLDYEDEDDDSEAPRRRKKPWRYRWPDDIRDEVLARLLALNAERAKEELLAGEAAAAQEAKTGARKSRKKSSTTSPPKNQIGFEFKES
jgi:hypothetical protein